MAPNTATARRLRILVTGAGGLIGRALCGALAERGHAVAGLLRRRGTPSGTEAPQVSARPYDGRLTQGAITLFEGDVAEPGLGLRTAEASMLSTELDLVAHCAALTGFKQAPEAYRRVNVGGPMRMLEFTAMSDPAVPLLHVSTAYVCGDASGVIAELPGEASGDSLLTAARFNNGYEASKAEGEGLIWAAQRAGQVVAVARPSIVVGRWADGETPAFGAMYQLIRLAAEGRVRILPASAGASLDVVPVDHVVGGLVDIAERIVEANGRVFHLVSGRPLPITALASLPAAFPQFHAPRFVPPEFYRPDLFGERDRWLHDQVVEAYAGYLRPSPRFATTNLLDLGGRRCPPVDEAFLHRLIAFAIAEGYLPGRRVSGRRDSGGQEPAEARSPS